ncbi:hypothetical protein D187_003162 [Cystobacter fuscus DSM 2262]|uniref:Uncharacterized protein n=1 Tax=Cystobacter fuscus (strain ATCC 25194 / DSM 2262 / NBRC 100088 / M29) TaxID=1242864 RepID=S9QRL6_CYSF2|nr:hypothetical protein D187_003162 [Cystobacter fuscus DSM 2262]
MELLRHPITGHGRDHRWVLPVALSSAGGARGHLRSSAAIYPRRAANGCHPVCVRGRGSVGTCCLGFNTR